MCSACPTAAFFSPLMLSVPKFIWFGFATSGSLAVLSLLLCPGRQCVHMSVTSLLKKGNLVGLLIHFNNNITSYEQGVPINIIWVHEFLEHVLYYEVDVIRHHCHMNLVWTYLSFNLSVHMPIMIWMFFFILWQHAELLTVRIYNLCIYNPKIIILCMYSCRWIHK